VRLAAGLLALAPALCWAAGAEPPLRVAPFRADAAPPPGEPNIWVTPVSRIEDPLWVKGVVLDWKGQRYVLCALDWCGVGGTTHRLFREKLARAVETDLSRVVVQSVHQHSAPYIVEDGYELVARGANPGLRMSRRFLEDVSDRIAAAARAALPRLEPVDAVGTGSAQVDRVASARRILLPDGRLVTRYSTSGRDPQMAALPEGAVDRSVRTVTFSRAGRALVRIHFYATHPQTFCCDGRVSADFVGGAREALEKEEGVFQLYFTGGAGDVTVGKYNDGSDRARAELAQRLLAGLRASAKNSREGSVGPLRWRTVALRLPARLKGEALQEALAQASDEKGTAEERYRTAIPAAFALRREPLEAASLEIGAVGMLFLPGEPMLVFQEYARSLAPDRFVVLAGYGDIEPGYLCTDEAIRQGGYEPGASAVGAGGEALVKEAIRKLLRR
jgi:hypothetical protein